MNDFNTFNAADPAGAVAQRPAQQTPTPQQPKRRRKPPKSLEDQLAEAESRAEALRLKVEERYKTKCVALVDELYAKHSVGELKDDSVQMKRLDALRVQLDL